MTHDLHAVSLEAARQLQALKPPPPPPPGAEAAPVDLNAVAAQLQPLLTQENVQAALFNGKFNLGQFLKNAVGVYNTVAPIITLILTATGHPFPLPTIPPGVIPGTDTDNIPPPQVLPS